MERIARTLREKRSALRYKLVHKELPGALYLEDSGRAIVATAVDASKHGLGVALAERLAPGSRLRFEIGGHKIPLRVAWSNSERGSDFRHGLEVTDKEMDLEELLFEHGFLEVDLDSLP